ncbi:MAG: zinc ribbon domain-containing protein [Chloroflexi bacterium]|nr:zinc ribbon domain-containing protein [Chloroflexota bacterium]
MYCPTCGTSNVSEAKFCANCGAPLVQPAPPSPPEAGRSEAEIRVDVSPCTAAVALIPAGLIVGTSLGLIVDLARYGNYEIGAFLSTVLLVAGIAVAASMIPPRFNTGRIAVFGVPLIILGYTGQTGMGLIGVGIGMLLPLIFWRQLLASHRVTLAVLVVVGLTAGALGFVAVTSLGEGSSRFASTFALLVVAPAVLMKPVIKRTRRLPRTPI